MKSKLILSDILRTSWKYLKAQIWILAGLFIGYTIISMILALLFTPGSQSTIGFIIADIINILISLVFALGYIKNYFQTLDGDEPQFSAYSQQFHKIFTYLIASILMAVIVAIGCCFLILPGIYLALRLQFCTALIVEKDAGIIESLKGSWEITRGQVGSLLLLLLTMICVLIVGTILLGIGIFVAIPLTYMMYCYTFRLLSAEPKERLEENDSTLTESASHNIYNNNESIIQH